MVILCYIIYMSTLHKIVLVWVFPHFFLKISKHTHFFISFSALPVRFEQSTMKSFIMMMDILSFRWFQLNRFFRFQINIFIAGRFHNIYRHICITLWNDFSIRWVLNNKTKLLTILNNVYKIYVCEICRYMNCER